MKNTILFLSLFLFLACGDKEAGPSIETLIENGDLEAIKERKSALNAEVQGINEKLSKLNAFIEKNDSNRKETLVTIMTAKDTLFKHYIEVQGNVKTDQNVLIYPEYQGTLTNVYVRDGQEVRKGQVLARIDDGGLGSQLAQLEAQAALAKTTFERQKRLWDQKIGSEIQYLQAQTQFEASQSAVNQLKSQLGKTVVRAPFSGVIDDVITDQGTVVAPGQALFRIINLNEMYITAEVPERYVGSVVPGKKVEISLPILGKNLVSEVRQTGNYINPTNRNFQIEVSVPKNDGDIKPNLTARLSINDYTAENAILIPLNVINENADGEQYIYLAIAGENTEDSIATAKRQIIETGKTQGSMIEVLAGLKGGDRVIVEGARSVKEGQEVNILTY